MLRASEADLPDDWREQVARMYAMRPPSPPEGRVDAQSVGSVRILGLFGGGGFFVGGGCRF